MSRAIHKMRSGLIPATVSFLGDDSNNVDLTTYTFSGKSLGVVAVAGTRLIVVSVYGTTTSAPKTLDSVTIAGVSAIQIVAQTTTSIHQGIWAAAVPTGTTGDIVCTFSGIMSRCGIGWYRAIVIDTVVRETATASGTDPISTTINVLSHGICIAVATTQGATTSTWTGLTEDFDYNLESAFNHSGASDAFATAQTGLTVEDDFAAPGATQFLNVAAWR